MVLFLGKWLTLAFVLESLMINYVPAELLGQWLGSGSTWAIPLSAVIGVPAYLNGFVAVPVVAGLIENGMTPGAALSFMLAGAMTSIPAAIAVFSLVRAAAVFLVCPAGIDRCNGSRLVLPAISYTDLSDSREHRWR